LRKKYLDIFVYGNFCSIDRDSEEVFAYTRQYADQKAMVVCNFTDSSLLWDPVANGIDRVTDVLLNNYESTEKVFTKVAGKQWTLRPYEAYVLLVQP
jgi:glycosidase